MPKCAGCPDLVRPEDDFTRDDQGRFWHIDCLDNWLIDMDSMNP